MIKCKHSTGLFIKSSYMNQVSSLTSIPHEPIVVVHKATQKKQNQWANLYKQILIKKSQGILSKYFFVQKKALKF